MAQRPDWRAVPFCEALEQQQHRTGVINRRESAGALHNQRQQTPTGQPCRLSAAMCSVLIVDLSYDPLPEPGKSDIHRARTSALCAASGPDRDRSLLQSSPLFLFSSRAPQPTAHTDLPFSGTSATRHRSSWIAPPISHLSHPTKKTEPSAPQEVGQLVFGLR